jgi:NAD(P)-dependent dehydrogenase (short-subunit alcohol dehydrogenase family)
MSSLTGKVAIVTASSRGIGRSLALAKPLEEKPLGTRIALRLGRDGAAVAVILRTASRWTFINSYNPCLIKLLTILEK